MVFAARDIRETENDKIGSCDAWQKYQSRKNAGAPPPADDDSAHQTLACRPEINIQAFIKGRSDPTESMLKRQFNNIGERLDKLDWHGVEIVPVRKDFVFTHPNVEARTQEECELMRMRLGIHVLNEDISDVPKPIECLEETPFPDWAAEVLRQRCWEKPTPIQVQGWPAALHGHDVIGIASTGSGKTLAYVMPMLVHIMAQPELKPGEGPVGVILVPHRELARQVAKEVQAFSEHTGLVVESISGGTDQELQKAAFLERVDVIVATPGRLIAVLNDRSTNLARATYLVLDEADELLHEGYGSQIRLIVSQIRPDRQVLLFSATWQDNVEEFAHEVCQCAPIRIHVGGTKLAACKDIDQCFWCPGKGPNPAETWPVGETKIQVLCRALRSVDDRIKSGAKTLIFCNKSETVPWVVEELRNVGFICEPFTGILRQTMRDEILAKFQNPDSDLPILVCTQVLGRGHDIQDVKFVINFDFPQRIVEYVHRIGRTGRAGQNGFALTLLDEIDLRYAKEIVDLVKETGQEPPQWLKEESSRKKIKKYNQLYHTVKTGNVQNLTNGLGLAMLEDTKNHEEWKGRGLGRRNEFLKMCKEQGAARVWAPFC